MRASGKAADEIDADDLAELDGNRTLLLLASEKCWELDKSFEDLKSVCELVPELRALDRVLEEATDMKASGLPSLFHPEEVGLMGIAGAATVQAAIPTAKQVSSLEARERIAATQLPFFKRLFGGSALSRFRADSYLWENWQRIAEAIQVSGQKDWCLGLEMS